MIRHRLAASGWPLAEALWLGFTSPPRALAMATSREGGALRGQSKQGVARHLGDVALKCGEWSEALLLGDLCQSGKRLRLQPYGRSRERNNLSDHRESKVWVWIFRHYVPQDDDIWH